MISCSSVKEEADLIVYNAVVYCVDEDFSMCGAFAVKDGKFIATGSTTEITGRYRSNQEVDAGNRPVYPGFIDAHCHFLGYGLGLATQADLTGALSPKEAVERVMEHHREHPHKWITGRGWDQNGWPEKKFPTRELLDRYFPDNPVYLTRVDGHAAWVNSMALKEAGIFGETPVEGGRVVILGGKPTGILLDNAMELVKAIIPTLDRDMKREALRAASSNCFAVGLTTVFDAGLEYGDVALIDSLYRMGKTGVRINAMLAPTDENITHFVEKGTLFTPYLVINTIKLYADGALGSRGALLLSPYTDDPANYGIQVTGAGFIRDICRVALGSGYAVSAHAIGDSANRLVLGIYGEALGGINDRRWRIEHAQVIHSDDFSLFEKYSVIPSVQPTHATSDMRWAVDRLGRERIKGAYAYRQLMDQNGWIPLGTDFPVEQIYPLHTFYAAVERSDLRGYPDGGFQMENALTREDALKGMTLWAARSGFMEGVTGSIEPGKYADFVIFDKDIMTVPADSILSAKALSTWLGGALKYSHPEGY